MLGLLALIQEAQWATPLIALAFILLNLLMVGFQDLDRFFIHLQTMSLDQWLDLSKTFIPYSVTKLYISIYTLGIMEGEDINDSNCINFN